MKSSWENMLEQSEKEPTIVFFKGNDCGLCEGEILRFHQEMEQRKLSNPFEVIDIGNDALARGQAMVFSVPTVVILYQGTEYVRESRFINWNNFFGKLNELEANP